MNYSKMDRLETKYSYAMESCSTPQTGWQDEQDDEELRVSKEVLAYFDKLSERLTTIEEVLKKTRREMENANLGKNSETKWKKEYVL